MKKINLCCGYKILKGYENYDIKPVNDNVKYIDLAFPLPFKTNSVDVVKIDNGVEHININPLALMEEVYRILKVGGKADISLPVYSPYIYHIRHNHPPYYFNPICSNSDVDETYINGSFKMIKKRYIPLTIKMFLGRIRNTLVKYTCKEIQFIMEKE